jgi:hypothetical protein
MAAIRYLKAFLVALLVGMASVAVVGMTARDADASGSVGFSFYSPSRTIECVFSNSAVACASFGNAKLVVLNPTIAAMTVTVSQGFGSKNPECKVRVDLPCWFQSGGRGPVLRFGASATDPDPRTTGAPRSLRASCAARSNQDADSRSRTRAS